MKKPKKKTPGLSLTLDGKAVPAQTFRVAVTAFLDILEDTATAITGKRGAIEWLISVKQGSNVLEATAVSRSPDVEAGPVAKTVQDGMRSVQRGRGRPVGFPDSAVRRTRDLANLVDSKGGYVSEARVTGSGRPFLITERAARNADKLIGAPVVEHGEIEGRVLTVSEYPSLHFIVQRRHPQSTIRCNFKPELEKKVSEAWRKRVVVRGTIAYHGGGEPISIAVESVDEVGPGTVPSYKEVRGILGAGNGS